MTSAETTTEWMNMMDEHGDTVLGFYAALNMADELAGHEEKFLSYKNNFDSTLLHHAVHYGALECAKKIVKCCPLLSCQPDANGTTPEQLSMMYDNTRMFKVLKSMSKIFKL